MGWNTLVSNLADLTDFCTASCLFFIVFGYRIFNEFGDPKIFARQMGGFINRIYQFLYSISFFEYLFIGVWVSPVPVDEKTSYLEDAMYNTLFSNSFFEEVYIPRPPFSLDDICAS